MISILAKCPWIIRPLWYIGIIVLRANSGKEVEMGYHWNHSLQYLGLQEQLVSTTEPENTANSEMSSWKSEKFPWYEIWGFGSQREGKGRKMPHFS